MKTESTAGASAAGAKRRRLGILSLVPAILFVLAAVWFYLGFYKVDPLHSRLAGVLMWAARLAIPPVLGICLGVGVAVKRKKVSLAAVSVGMLVLVLGTGLLLLVGLGVRTLGAGGHDLSQYHPYLQLAPYPLDLRESAGDVQPRRVFCLGGSTTEFKDSNGKGWPARLEESLADAPAPVQVYNAGRQWYTSVHSLINFELNLRQHNPDIIIVMHAINDLLHNADFSTLSLRPFREDYGHFVGPVVRLLRHESMRQRLQREFRSIWWHRTREEVEAESFPGLATYVRSLRTLIELARADGTRVVLMTQPHLFKPNQSEDERKVLYLLNYEAVGPRQRWGPATALRGMRAYNDAMRAMATEEGLPLIDLEKVIPKSLEYLSDDVHYQDKAYDLVADVVAKHIGPMVGIEPAALIE